MMQGDRNEPSRLTTLLPWVIPLALLLTWAIVSGMEWVPSFLLPRPQVIARTAYSYIFGNPGEGSYAGRFFSDASASLIRVGAGFACAVALGIPLGVLSGRLALVNRLFSTLVNGLRAVPGITWLPLAMVWFGIGLKTTLFLVALAAFFPIYLNSAAGARQLNPKLLQAGAMMGVNRIRGTFAILLPGAMPHILTGLRLGLGISWAYLVLGELTGVPDGLGAVIMDARMVGRVDMICVGMVMIAFIGRMSDQFFTASMKFFFKSARRMT